MADGDAAGRRHTEPTIEEIVIASGLHQQGSKFEVKLTNPTIEEVVVASGLHRQGWAREEPGQEATPSVRLANPTIEEILVASGLHQQRTAEGERAAADAPTIEEIVVASGLHQQGSKNTATVSNPTIEEIVVASGLHQQGWRGHPSPEGGRGFQARIPQGRVTHLKIKESPSDEGA